MANTIPLTIPNGPVNCHGCMHLDEVHGKPWGTGYCANVERSEAGKARRKEHSMYGVINSSLKVRRPDMAPCELYEPGDFRHRFDRR